MTRNLDPATVEIVRSAILNISREMRIIVHKTAYSSTIQESQDFSAAIFEKSENALSFAHGISAHVGGLARAAKLVVKKFEDENEQLDDNDIILFDDPYWGGSHTCDVTMLSICKYDDVMFLPVVRGHWSDIGGMSPGSISGEATELFQEGLLLPPVKLFEKGIMNKALYQTILANMRMPDQRAGDIYAFTAACRIASERLKSLCDKHGSENVKISIREMIEQTEERTKAAISTIPPGSYEFENYIDSDGITPEPYRIQIKCQVERESILVDFSGTSEQAKGPTNSPIGSTEAAVFNTLKCMIDPYWPVNEGFFRPFQIVAPVGTIVNPIRPAATGSVWEVTLCVVDALIGALAGNVKFIGAPGLGAINHTHIGGIHPKTGLQYVWYEAPKGGSGANERSDGENCLASVALSGDSKDYSIERAEAEFPLRWEEYSLRIDSGGPGALRGGLGIVRNVKCLDRNREVSTIWDRSRIPGFGLFGAIGGAPQRILILKADGTKELFPLELGSKVTMKPIGENDILSLNTTGGGGYGD
ncbi:MAG: hydantoinase B/oxoprolinase family protein, partial [Nitrososphaerales archaeon]